jgi:hypothetical protein
MKRKNKGKTENHLQQKERHIDHVFCSVKSAPAKIEKKLTPMEKLKLKMRAGLEKQSTF